LRGAISALALKFSYRRLGLLEQAARAVAPLEVNGNQGLVFTTKYLVFSFRKAAGTSGSVQPAELIADLRSLFSQASLIVWRSFFKTGE
jgi:hypothetical protein